VSETESSSRKKGALSTSDMSFAVDNCRKMSIKDIADALNRTEATIRKFLESRGLQYSELSTGDEDKAIIRAKLEKRYYFPGVKTQLLINKDINELEIFINKWIDLMLQFNEDVLPSEEEQIKELIMLSINLERVRRYETRNIIKIEELEKKIDEEYEKDEANRDLAKLARCEDQLGMCRASSKTYTDQTKVINTDIHKLNEQLKATRDQRFKRVESSDKTFIGIIRKLQDSEKRMIMSKDAELTRLATEKERLKLYDFHKFGDGEVDRPIMNHESIIYSGEDTDEERTSSEEG
jgi:hypothetical protein